MLSRPSGSTGLRLRLADGATWHTGHGLIEGVTNHSQQLVPHAVEFTPEVWSQVDPGSVGHKLHAASHDLGLTDVLLVSDIAAEPTAGGTTKITFHASRPLTKRQQQLIADRDRNTQPRGARAAPRASPESEQAARTARSKPFPHRSSSARTMSATPEPLRQVRGFGDGGATSAVLPRWVFAQVTRT